MINYTLSQISAFLAVAETKSFRLASERLHITQSAVSTRVNELEKQLGVKLLNRTTRSVSITKHGERLSEIAIRVLGELQEAVESIHSEAMLEQGLLVISCMFSVAETFLPELMRDFKRRYPSIQVELRDTVGDGTVDLVTAGHADFGIYTPVVGQEDIVFEPLMEDELFVVARLDHPMARVRSITLAEVTQHDMIGPSKQTGLRRTIDNAFNTANLTFSPRQEAAGIATVLRLVENGFGMAFIPGIFSSRIDLSVCRKIKLENGKINRILGIVTSKGRSLSPAAAAFLDLLRNRVKQF
jgi:DNA-binding transcriptional LysR family regulator